MKTPAGNECRFYYADYHRGRSRQECRLLKDAGGPERWHPDDCRRCPVPDILWANASENLRLKAHIQAGFLGIGRRVEIGAWCSKHDSAIDDPYVGCQHCIAERPNLADLLERSDT